MSFSTKFTHSLSLTIFCVLATNASALADETTAADKNALPTPLQGGVTDTWMPADRLPLNQWRNNIKPRLEPGVKWNDALLPQQFTEELWVQIPSWLAGVWHSEKASFTGGSAGSIGETSDYLSRHDDSFGYQRDKNGGIWHLIRFPFISTTKSDKTLSYFIAFTQSANTKNQFHINLDADDIEVIVTRADGKIQQVQHRHDATSWIKIGNTISVDDQMSVEGASMRNGTIRTQPKMVRPFKQIDRLPDGYDVKSSLNRYLNNSGKSALIVN